jgi:hypothetical protein
MKKVKSTGIKKATFLCLIMPVPALIFPFFAMAQDPGGGPDAPIDGGLSVLLAAGVGYGIKKYRAHRKARNQNETYAGIK